MKKSFISLLVLVGFVSFMMSSCNTDKCKNANCGTHGQCLDPNTGNCVCSVGYEGANCSTLSRTKFFGAGGTGTYRMYETVSSTTGSFTDNYTMTFMPSTSSETLMNILNFFAPGSAVTVQMAGVDSFTVASGQTATGGSNTVSIVGGGRLLGTNMDSIQMYTTLTYPSGSTATCIDRGRRL